ncbi:hypothetical protein [Sphingobium sp.]|uniref:hypothetical protein n=1 Tax=Sphingobium sp. TaxID=1912891 RepID=UPI003BB6052C
MHADPHSSAHRGDSQYFQAIVDEMENGGLQAMLYDLLTFVPENGWNVLRTAPVTLGLKEQVVDSLRGIDRFMYELLSTGMYECDNLVDGGIFLSEDHGTDVSMKELRVAARVYLADHHSGQKAVSFDLIERAVREWFSANVVTRPGRQNASRWVFFPSLAECREHVRRTKGMEIPAPKERKPSLAIAA